MKILGIRNYTGGFRYCIIEGNKDSYQCVNLNEENKVQIPKGEEENAIFIWYKDEIERIINNNGLFDKIVIKQNENTPSRYSLLKQVMFFDCIATIVALEQNIQVDSFVYNNLKVNAKSVKQDAESKVGKSLKYWDTKIADAIVASVKSLAS